jgi:ribosomal-protein-alanine N-acetyltransferase
MEELEYREATKADIVGMAELDNICFTIPWSLAEFKAEILKNHLAFYLVCTHGSTIVGYAGLWAIEPEGHITNLAVHPDYRRRGIGSQLLEKLLKQSRERLGLNKFTLEVRISNVGAIKLYSRFGFKLAGHRKMYYKDTNEDALILWLIDLLEVET